MTDRSKTVVMLIDWDNLQICHSRDAPGTELDLYALIALAQSYGTLVSARAYAEWNLATERLAVYKAGIEPVFAPVMRPEGSLREGKSLADTVMVAEGVDLLWTVAPDVFVLVTSDKDMIPLARIAKQRGAAVVVLGSDLTAIPLVEISNVFITYRQLLRELDRVTELDAPSGRAPARERRGLRETRRPGGEPYGSSPERRSQGGMRAVAAPAPAASTFASVPPPSAPSLGAFASAPAPSVPATAPPRREESDRPATFAPVTPVAGVEGERSDVGSITNGDGGARRRRRRGGRGRGRPGEFSDGNDRLQEIEAALMAGLPLNEPLPAESVEALAYGEVDADEPPASSDDPVAETPVVVEPSAVARPTRTRRRVPASERSRSTEEPPSTQSSPSAPPTPSQRPTFGQVRRGIAFSEFGAPPAPPTIPPATTGAASGTEPNDAGVGPAAETTPSVSIESGAASVDGPRATEETEPTIADAPSEPPTLSLVPAGATPDDNGSGELDVSAGATNGQSSPSGPDSVAEASDAPDSPVGAGVATADADAPPLEADAGGTGAVAEPVAAEPAPKPVRRRRTRRPATPAADVANG